MSRQIRRLGFSKNVEIAIRNNQQTIFPFSDSVLLFDKVLVHAFYVRCIDGGRTIDFRTNLPIGQLGSAFLTLAGFKNQQFNMHLPLAIGKGEYFYNNPALSFTYPIFYIKPKLISLANSKLTLPNVDTLVMPGDGLGYGLNITFFYEAYNPSEHQLNEWDELVNEKDFEN